MAHVNILELGAALLGCQSPARYAGGEIGRRAKRAAALRAVFAFPDLYEIGMSNNALKIIYNRLNDIDDVSCDRVFAPAPDFEALLCEKNIPLYGLDTGIPLCDVDILLFTISYELCATTILAMLAAGRVPLRSAERGKSDPIVIAGGPCASNPLPFSPFFDGFWIGEAEGTPSGGMEDGNFFELASALRDAKKRGAERAELLLIIEAHPSVWTAKKPNAHRAIDRDFGSRPPRQAIFPLPSLRVAQEHGTVEIMRGCPNGCRFCHAGVWYKPARQKNPEHIEAEVAMLVREGYREISLASLSSGDYKGIESLVDRLVTLYDGQRVSFQLPSLHVSTLSLELLDKISSVRKGGLTFAVESPLDAVQLSINKRVTLEMVCALLLQAKKSGYKSAKFYFMIGLMDKEASFEAEAIVDFINEAAKRARMRFSVSVGVFIPKPHTPFQWKAQLEPEPARHALFFILDTLKKQGHKVSVHDSFCSYLEGIIARGDERVAGIIEPAYKQGCRLDAWNEYFNRNIWQSIVEENAALAAGFTGARSTDSALPWDGIKK